MPVNERHRSVSNCKMTNKDPTEAYNLYMVLTSCHTRGLLWKTVVKFC